MIFATTANVRSRNYKPYSAAAVGRSTWALPMLGLAIVALQAGGVAAQLSDAVRVNIALILAQGGVFLLAVRLQLRGAPVSLGWVVAIALILRLTILFLPPYHSNDIYRYVWDGQVQSAGINPYLYIPNDPALAGVRDQNIWPNINRGEYAPTIYPPGAQILFFLITRVAASVDGMKVAWVLFEGVTAWGIVRILEGMRLPSGRLLIYAWSPLVVWEIAGSGHLDAAMTTFVVLAVLARMRDRYGLAGATLGFAVLVKFFPLVVLPALWRRWDWRLPTGCAAVVIAGYLIYLRAGLKVLGFLSGYSHEEGLSNGNGLWFARLVVRATGIVLPSLVYLAAVAVALGCVALFVALSRDPAKYVYGALILAAGAMVALSPNHPWYFLWLTPFLCFVPSPALLWLTVVSPLLYWPNPYDVPWNSDVLYGGLCLLASVSLWRRRTKLHRLPRGAT